MSGLAPHRYGDQVRATAAVRAARDSTGSAIDARTWADGFVQWYNTEHRHSGLKFVTPQQRHRNEAPAIMRRRVVVYEQARARQPRRWSKGIRDWSLPSSVWLNPMKTASPAQAQAA